MKGPFGVRKVRKPADAQATALVNADLIVILPAFGTAAGVSLVPDRFRFQPTPGHSARQLAAHVHYPGRPPALLLHLQPLFQRVQGGACALFFADPDDEVGLSLCTALLRCQHAFLGLQSLAGHGPEAQRRFLARNQEAEHSTGTHGISVPVPIGFLRAPGNHPRDTASGQRLEWSFVWQLSWEPFRSVLQNELDLVLRVLGHLYVKAGGSLAAGDSADKPKAAAVLGKAETFLSRLFLDPAWWKSFGRDEHDPSRFHEEFARAYGARRDALFQEVFGVGFSTVKVPAGTEWADADTVLAAVPALQARLYHDDFRLLPRLNQPGDAMLSLELTNRRLQALTGTIAVLERDRLGWPVAFALRIGSGCLAVLPSTISERGFTTAMQTYAVESGKRGLDLLTAFMAAVGKDTTAIAPARKVSADKVEEEDVAPEPMTDDAYLNTIEAAKFLGVGRTTFYRLRKENDVPVQRIGGMDRFLKSDLQRVLVGKKRKAGAK